MFSDLLANDNIVSVLAGGAFLLLTIMLLAVIVWQRNRAKQLDSQDHSNKGLLGSPLASFLIVGFIIFGFGVVYVVNQGLLGNKQSISVSEEATVDFKIISQSNIEEDGMYTVRFSLSPQINSVAWPNPEVSYDAYWSVSGPEEFYKFELDLNAQNKGGFSRELPGGIYLIRVDVVGEDQDWTVERTINL